MLVPDLTFQERSIGVIITDFEWPAFRRLVVSMDLLALVSAVAWLILKVCRVKIYAPLKLVVDGLTAESQLPRYLRYRYLVPVHSFELVPFVPGHVVLFSHEYPHFLVELRTWFHCNTDSRSMPGAPAPICITRREQPLACSRCLPLA